MELLVVVNFDCSNNATLCSFEVRNKKKIEKMLILLLPWKIKIKWKNW